MTDLFDRPTLKDENPTRPSRAEQRARRAAKKRRARRRRRTTAVLLVCLLVVGGAGYLILTNATSLLGFDNPVAAKDFDGPGTEPVDVTIEPGSTGREMGQALVDAGVVASTAAFVSAYEDNAGSSSIQAGTHQLLTGMPAKDAVARLVANDSRVETRITVPEGLTAEQILERASSVTGISVADFQTAMKDTDATGLPAEAKGNYEGWLYPTTYVLDPDEVDATGVIQRMVGQTVSELDEAGVEPSDRQRVLTIASLIEREAKYAPDRPKMAQTIQNRLDRDMDLEIDSTVAYGMHAAPGYQVGPDDLKDTSNAYNTYAHNGLPPGPIASPSTSSVDAVLHPEPGDWLFWTAVNLDTGETKFAENFEQHKKNVDELKQWVAENP